MLQEPPYEIVKVEDMFVLQNADTEIAIDYAETKSELKEMRNKLNTDWFFRTYVGL